MYNFLTFCAAFFTWIAT